MAKIVIDPGHGGSDPGAINGSYQEKNFTLAIALKVRDYLVNHYQATLLMTRTTDKTVSLQERVALANSNDADYFCSIHINSGGGTGWESYIFDGTVSSQTVQRRDIIHNTVLGIIGPKYGVRDRGKKRANFYVLRETKMPAVLMENLFIDHTNDLNQLRNSTFTNDLASAIGEGIAKALALPRKTWFKVIAGAFKDPQHAEDRKEYLATKGIESIVVQVTISGETWYRVQAGAFRIREHAESRLQEVKEAGITDVYIIEEP